MVAGAVMHTIEVQRADVDRGVYETLSLRMAQHPSETSAFMMTRRLAYCLEYADGIVFSEGVAATDEPAVLVRDATGTVTVWIEVGAPDAERLHRGSKLADRTVVYSHRDPARLLPLWAGKKIHHASEITLQSFDPGFIDAAAATIARRNTVSLSVMEGQLYLDINGQSLTSALHTVPIA